MNVTVRMAMGFGLMATVLGTTVDAVDPKPKYGPQATALSQSHDYFKKSEAPDFWALMPYYTAQQDESACSVASVTMVLNGARSHQKLTADQELVTQKNLLAKVTHPGWKKGFFKLGRGVTLDQLGEILEESFKKHGFKEVKATVVHTEDAGAETLAKLRSALSENEKSTQDFIVLNFLQNYYTDDAEVGHIAPLGAYDAEKKRALVLDPDRTWYEPYWVSDEVLLKGMATLDKGAKKNRGYVWVSLSGKQAGRVQDSGSGSR